MKFDDLFVCIVEGWPGDLLGDLPDNPTTACLLDLQDLAGAKLPNPEVVQWTRRSLEPVLASRHTMNLVLLALLRDPRLLSMVIDVVMILKLLIQGVEEIGSIDHDLAWPQLMIPVYVIENTQLTPATKLVYGVMTNIIDRGEMQSRPQYARCARILGLNSRTVKRSVKSLIGWRLLEFTPSGGLRRPMVKIGKTCKSEK